VPGDAAADLLVAARSRRARVRHARRGVAHLAALGLALVRRPVLAFRPVVVGKAARLLARLDAVVRDVVVEYVLAVVVRDFQVLATRIRPEALLVPSRPRDESRPPLRPILLLHVFYLLSLAR